MTMLRPSAAPRWKMATRILRLPCAAAAARPSQKGTAPAPAMAMAEPRRKILLVSIGLSPLKFGRADDHAGDEAGDRLFAAEALVDGGEGLRGGVAMEQVLRDGGGVLAGEARGVDGHAGELAVDQRIG